MPTMNKVHIKKMNIGDAAAGESRGRQEDTAEVSEPVAKKQKTTAANGGQPTVRCRHWARGSCRLEDKCNFAHVGEPGQPLCRHWARGKCNLGQECKFSHYGEPGQGPAFRPAVPFFQYQPPQNSYFQPQGQPTPPQYGQAGGFPPQGMYQPPAPAPFQPGFGGFQPGFPPNNRRGGQPCRHHARGYCERGDACQFSHVPRAAGQGMVGGGGGGGAPCRHFARGFCQLGQACKFSHD